MRKIAETAKRTVGTETEQKEKQWPSEENADEVAAGEDTREPRANTNASPPKDTVEFDGVVVEQMRNASFRVELENGHTLLARVAGKMRRFRIRVMPGDRVQVAMSTYDTSMGRITYRYRN